MFCRKCGRKIPADSFFCPYCSEKVLLLKQTDDEQEQARDSEPEAKKTDAEENKSDVEPKSEIKSENESEVKSIGCFFAVAIAIFLIILTLGICCNMTRDANNTDITVTTDLNLNKLGVDLVITPNKDIDGLNLEINFYDNQNRIIKTETEYIGDVKKGIQTRVTVSILNFSFSEMTKVQKVGVEVIGGKAHR